MTPRIYPINTTAELRTAVRRADDERSLYFVTLEGEVVCQDHVHDFIEDYADRIAGYAINRDNPNLRCAVLGVRIPTTGGTIE